MFVIAVDEISRVQEFSLVCVENARLVMQKSKYLAFPFPKDLQLHLDKAII